jgi:predicted DCC family thiol-disulfide oxidoreductase YuxK
VVFFDGVCGLCDIIVNWLLERDEEHRFHFAALQGETAARLRRVHPEAFPGDLDTIVYLDNSSGDARFALRSRAIFAILRELGGPTRHWALLGVLPAFVTDLGYRALAASRYRIFGTLDACRIPTPDERARFLD